jgi:hypothetical protein
VDEPHRCCTRVQIKKLLFPYENETYSVLKAYLCYNDFFNEKPVVSEYKNFETRSVRK